MGGMPLTMLDLHAYQAPFVPPRPSEAGSSGLLVIVPESIPHPPPLRFPAPMSTASYEQMILGRCRVERSFEKIVFSKSLSQSDSAPPRHQRSNRRQTRFHLLNRFGFGWIGFLSAEGASTMNRGAVGGPEGGFSRRHRRSILSGLQTICD